MPECTGLPMDDLTIKYKCPACDKAVLNRRVGHCLYCSEALPAEFIFSAEKIARLDEESKLRDDIRKCTNPGPTIERRNIIGDVVDGVDLISDIGDLLF